MNIIEEFATDGKNIVHNVELAIRREAVRSRSERSKTAIEAPRSKLRGPRSSLPSSIGKEIFVIRSLCRFRYGLYRKGEAFYNRPPLSMNKMNGGAEGD